MEGSRKVTAPMPYKGELTSDLNGVSEQEHKWFRSVMGPMQWYSHSRYDISYEVSIIAQYCAKPTQWNMYSDSDHAGETAGGTSRSHIGVMIMLNGMLIHWRSNKQPKTSLSSAEAEIYAMSTAVKDARTRLWIAEELNCTTHIQGMIYRMKLAE